MSKGDFRQESKLTYFDKVIFFESRCFMWHKKCIAKSSQSSDWELVSRSDFSQGVGENQEELCNVVGIWSQKGCKHNLCEVGQASVARIRIFWAVRPGKQGPPSIKETQGLASWAQRKFVTSRKYAKRQGKAKQSISDSDVAIFTRVSAGV